jgi:hypothetical protein
MRKREGIEPRYERETVGADAVSKAEGHIKGADMARAPMNPPGSETGARHHGRAGNSGGPMDSSHERSRGGTTGKPGGSPTIHRKSDVPI